MKPTFNTGLDLSAMDFRSSMAALVTTEVRADGAGAKAAADPINRERRDSFMATKESLLFLFCAGTGKVRYQHASHVLMLN
jgi:hypothetical protein